MYHILWRSLNTLTSLPCVACGEPVVASADPLCIACWGALFVAAEPAPIHASFCGVGVSWLPYGSAEVKRVMGAIKFRGQHGLAVQLGSAMAAALPPPEVDALVPVPLAASRAYLRGYNQAERIAHGMHLRWGLPVVDDLLHRPAWFAPKQSARSAAERSLIYGAYEAHSGSPWAGARVALVDDTFTTGSSLNAAAEALIKKARVAKVVPLTLAYTSRRSA